MTVIDYEDTIAVGGHYRYLLAILYWWMALFADKYLLIRSPFHILFPQIL